VKTPFAGWIRKVYADATGNFIGKGEPLFTVSSPDLVATEQAYLLAKKNSESLQRSSASGVARSAAYRVRGSWRLVDKHFVLARASQFPLRE
jgi:hypothetical protein